MRIPPIIKQTSERGALYSLTLVLQLICTGLVSRSISIESRAHLIGILSIIPILSCCVTLGITNIVPAITKGNSTLVRLYIKKHSITLIVLCAAIYAIPMLLYSTKEFSIRNYISFSSATLVITYNFRTLISGCFVSLGSTTIETALTALSALVLLLSCSILFLSKSLTIDSYIISFYTSQGLAAIIGFVLIIRKTKNKSNTCTNNDKLPNIKSTVSMGCRSLLHICISLLKRRVDYFLALAIAPTAQAGQYSALTTYSQYNQSPTSIFGQILLSHSAQSASKDLKILKFSVALICTLSLFAAITVMFIGDAFWILLLGEQYKNSSSIFPYYILFLVFSAGETLLSFWLSGKGFPKTLIIHTATGTILTLILGIIFYKTMGTSGIALGAGIASLVTFILLAKDIRKN